MAWRGVCSRQGAHVQVVAVAAADEALLWGAKGSILRGPSGPRPRLRCVSAAGATVTGPYPTSLAEERQDDDAVREFRPRP